jgi:outer membrane protein assembly factor BamB
MRTPVSAPRTVDDAEAEQIRSRLLAHLSAFAVWTCEQETIFSSNGGRASWLIDLKGSLLRGTALDDVAHLFWNSFESRLPFQIGGLELAGVPLVAAILLKGVARGHRLNGFIVRKERKRYGLARLIEGELLADQAIVIVDDITNSGKSLDKVKAVLEQEDRRIDAAFAVIDFHSRVGVEWREKTAIPVSSLFTPEMLGLNPSNSQARPQPRIDAFAPAWKFRPSGADPFFVMPKSAPVVHGDAVFFGIDSGIFHCLNATDGEVVWEFEAKMAGRKGIWSTPAVTEAQVIFGAYNGNVYCLCKLTGAVLWTFQEADWVGSSPLVVVDLRLVIIGLEFERADFKGALAALDLRTGEKRWQVPTRKYVHGTPSYDAKTDSVFVGTNEGTVLAIDARSGAERWRFAAGGAVWGGIAIEHHLGCLAIGTCDGHLHVLDTRFGIERFSVDVSDPVYSTPLILDKKIFVTSGTRSLFVIEVGHGTVTREIPLRAKSVCSPALHDGRVYVGANDGTVLEFDAKTLDVLGSFSAPDAVTNPIAFHAESGLLYVMTSMNHLFAIARRRGRL